MSMNHSAPQSLIQRLIITPDFNRVLRQAYLLLPILHPKMRNKFRAVRVIRTLERQKKWKKQSFAPRHHFFVPAHYSSLSLQQNFNPCSWFLHLHFTHQSYLAVTDYLPTRLSQLRQELPGGVQHGEQGSALLPARLTCPALLSIPC